MICLEIPTIIYRVILSFDNLQLASCEVHVLRGAKNYGQHGNQPRSYVTAQHTRLMPLGPAGALRSLTLHPQSDELRVSGVAAKSSPSISHNF